MSTDGFTDTGATGSIVYGYVATIGFLAFGTNFLTVRDQTSAQGPILLGNVTFGAFVVGQQAFSELSLFPYSYYWSDICRESHHREVMPRLVAIKAYLVLDR
jgi:hypothetical protein